MIASSYPRYAGDGAGSFIGSLARALVALGHEVHVVAPYDPAVADMEQGGVNVSRFRYAPGDAWCVVGHAQSLRADRKMRPLAPLLMPAFIAAASQRALALHRCQPFDVLHGHWAVPGGVIAGLVARLTGLPLVISLHGSDVYVIQRNHLYAAAARSGFRRAGWVTACSEDLRTRAQAVGLDAARSSVLPYGVDVERYASGDGQRMRQRLGIPASAPVIGALGRLVYKKGFAHLVAAMPAVLAHTPQAYCVIGGGGDLQGELEAHIQRLGLTERVLLAGPIGWQDTPDFYAMCSALAVPSVVDVQGNVDGLPNVLLEALASGCAVVAARVAGIPAVVQEEVNGLLTPPGDEQALAEALVRILGDSQLSARLGAQGRQGMRANYRWPIIAARTVSIYEEAIAHHAGHRRA